MGNPGLNEEEYKCQLEQLSASFIGVIVIIILLVASIRTVRPTSRGLIERFGRYNRFANPGIVFLVPFIERLIRINITENMIDAGLQEIITSDSLNAQVDAQVYFKVRTDEESVKASQYSVFNYMSADCSFGKNHFKKHNRYNDFERCQQRTR